MYPTTCLPEKLYQKVVPSYPLFYNFAPFSFLFFATVQLLGRIFLLFLIWCLRQPSCSYHSGNYNGLTRRLHEMKAVPAAEAQKLGMHFCVRVVVLGYAQLPVMNWRGFLLLSFL
jgi:hypothetical protein